MRTVVCAIALVSINSSCSAMQAQPINKTKTTVIPVKEIWSNRMPGTRKIEDLKRNQAKISDGQLWRDIANVLIERGAELHKSGKRARDGFAVEGSGAVALRGAHAVFVDGEKKMDSFAVGENVTLVFFSHPVAGDVHLLPVERRGNVINAPYKFVGRAETYLSIHLALIPLGELPIGKYQVKFTAEPKVQHPFDAKKLIDAPQQVESNRRFVSQSFSFEVTGKSD